MGLVRGIGGTITLAKGQTHFWHYIIDNGRDVGVATAAPDILGAFAGQVLVARDQAVTVQPVGQEGSAQNMYFVNVVNTGATDVSYTLNVGIFG